jgi:hypothetical protein
MFVRWLWVWLGGTLLLLGSNDVPVFVAGGLVHCWVLRRHLCGCFFGAVSWAGRLTHPVCVVGVVVSGVRGCGCVLSVA